VGGDFQNTSKKVQSTFSQYWIVGPKTKLPLSGFIFSLDILNLLFFRGLLSFNFLDDLRTDFYFQPLVSFLLLLDFLSDVVVHLRNDPTFQPFLL